MSLLRELLAVKIVRTPLGFGIHDNVRLVKIDNAERMRENEVVNKNTYLTFAKFDANNNKIASSEFNYFNLDHTSDYVFDNLITQIGHLNKICSLLNPGSSIDPTEGYESVEEIKDALRTKKGCEEFMKAMWAQFEQQVEDYVGLESPLLRIKVITDSSGQFFNLPRESHFLELMENDCTLSISAYELRMHAKGAEPKTVNADEKGSKPEDKPRKSSLKNL